MANIDIPRILANIFKNCHEPSGRHGCVLWKGATYDGLYGKMRNPLSKLPNQPSYMRTHRLVYLLNNIHQYNNLFLPKTDEFGCNLDVSHVCHNTLCINIAHLALESHHINCSRKHCVDIGRCNGEHEPACLL